MRLLTTRRGHSARRPRAVLAVSTVMLLIFGCVDRRSATTPHASSESTLTIVERQQNLATYDQVFERLQTRHWSRTAPHAPTDEPLRAAVASAKTARTARALLQRAVHASGRTDAFVVPPLLIEGLLPGSAKTAHAHPGLSLRIANGRVVVIDVYPDSSAARAGVRPGWEFVAIGEQPVEAVLQAAATTFADDSVRELVGITVLRRRLFGSPDSRVAVQFLDDHALPVQLELTRATVDERLEPFGSLPPQPVRIETRTIGENVGYIHLTALFDPRRLMLQFDQTLRTYDDATGIVLDLRGNPGGLSLMTMMIAGSFITSHGESVGTLRTNASTLPVEIIPRPYVSDRPLAVLVDSCTASTAEVLALILQDYGRARLFGQRTAGVALPPAVERLPNGDGLYYAIAQYESDRGVALNGIGVIPDVEVKPSRAALLADEDSALQAAVEWLATLE